MSRRWGRRGRLGSAPPAPGNEIYGTLTAAALLAIETDRRETLWQAGISLGVAIVALWLAHGYAVSVGHRFAPGEEETAFHHLVGSLRDEAGILRGVIIPLLVLTGCGLAGVSDSTAISAAFFSTVAVLVAVELIAGLFSSRRARDVVVEVGTSVIVGVGVVLLKYIVH
jgi:hypothetical protein